MEFRDRLIELFNYDSETGRFTNRHSRGRAGEGQRAGSPTGHGYRKITIDYCKYYEHHLAWYYTYGEWPDEIDHKDGDSSNNAVDNLRECTRSQNNFNAERATGASGLKGAYLDHRVQRWYSKIQLDGQVKWLGHFDTAQEANEAFMAAVNKYHGEFAYHNRPTPLIRRV